MISFLCKEDREKDIGRKEWREERKIERNRERVEIDRKEIERK